MIRPLLSGEELHRYDADGSVALERTDRPDAPLFDLHARGGRPSVCTDTHRDEPVLADRRSWTVDGEAAPDPGPGSR